MKIVVGKTPVEKYLLSSMSPESTSAQEVYLKREDLNPSGSFKDRLITHIWDELKSKSEVVLSSSGNLAISAAYFLVNSNQETQGKLNESSNGSGVKLTIFVKTNMPEEKLSRLENLAKLKEERIQIIHSQKSKSDAMKYAREHEAFLLRNSTGANYPDAFHALGEEISTEQIHTEQMQGGEGSKNFDAIFICTSSATACIGVIEGLQKKELRIPTFAVQTSYINPIAKEFDTNFTPEATTLANAISDRIAVRKSKAIELLAWTGGGAVVCNNEEITQAQATISELIKMEVSGNAALSYAGFSKLAKKGYNFRKPLIIISGN